MAFFYLSFCDPDRPKGTQFLGATIVEAPDSTCAVKRTWELGINPGGEVAILKSNKTSMDELGAEEIKYLNRFVSREEVMSTPYRTICGWDE